MHNLPSNFFAVQLIYDDGRLWTVGTSSGGGSGSDLTLLELSPSGKVVFRRQLTSAEGSNLDYKYDKFGVPGLSPDNFAPSLAVAHGRWWVAWHEAGKGRDVAWMASTLFGGRGEPQRDAEAAALGSIGNPQVAYSAAGGSLTLVVRTASKTVVVRRGAVHWSAPQLVPASNPSTYEQVLGYDGQHLALVESKGPFQLTDLAVLSGSDTWQMTKLPYDRSLGEFLSMGARVSESVSFMVCPGGNDMAPCHVVTVLNGSIEQDHSVGQYDPGQGHPGQETFFGATILSVTDTGVFVYGFIGHGDDPTAFAVTRLPQA